MSFGSLLKSLRTRAGRVRAATKRRLRTASLAGAPRGVTTGAISDPSLYPGLPGPALKAAVEKSLEGVKTEPHGLTRLAMYEALADKLAAHDSLRTRCLSISGSERLARVLGFQAADLIKAAYPEHTMLALDFADASFDACVSDQVLEHVEGNPFDAVRETFRVVKPGGFVVHATCLLNPIHREPGDFWRFTPDALALLCRAAGGQVIESGSWGNREALTLTQVGIRTTKVPVDRHHPFRRIASANDPAWPIHTWAIARKPG